MRSDEFDNQMKTIWIDIVTNYRIFQYDYLNNDGKGILFPSLEKVEVTKIKKTLRKSSIGYYTLLSSNLFPEILDCVESRIVGNITFFDKDNQVITFAQITDPETLSRAVMTLKQQQIYMQIGQIQKEPQLEESKPNYKQVDANQVIGSKLNENSVKPFEDENLEKINAVQDGITPSSRKLQLSLKGSAIDENTITTIRNNFDKNIIGYDDIKEFIILAIMAKMKDEKKRTHILLSGVPSTSKTVFLDNLYEALGQDLVFFTDGSACSKSGLIDALIDKASRIKFVFIDELDKMEKDDQSILLRALESGKMQETKYKKDRAVDVKHIFFMATSNDIDKILIPLQTRFRCINMPPYTYEEFSDISIKLLTKKYNFTRDVAERILGESVNGIGKDRITVRDVVGIADMLGDAETVDQSLKVVVEVWKNHSFNPE